MGSVQTSGNPGGVGVYASRPSGAKENGRGSAALSSELLRLTRSVGANPPQRVPSPNTRCFESGAQATSRNPGPVNVSCVGVSRSTS